MGPRMPRNCENPLPVKFKMADGVQIEYYLNGSNSAADCSISLKFGKDFDHMRADTLQPFKAKGQRSSSQRGVAYQQCKRDGKVDRFQT